MSLIPQNTNLADSSVTRLLSWALCWGGGAAQEPDVTSQLALSTGRLQGRPESYWGSDWSHLFDPAAARLFTQHLLTFIHRAPVFSFSLPLFSPVFTIYWTILWNNFWFNFRGAATDSAVISAYSRDQTTHSGLIYHRFAPSDNRMRSLVLDSGRYRCSALIIILHEGFIGSQTHQAAVIISHVSYLWFKIWVITKRPADSKSVLTGDTPLFIGF